MAKSAYLRSALLKHAVGKTAFTMPSGAYLALYTSDPTVNDSGTESTGGSYARQAITWGTESDGIIANSAAIEFAAMPASTVTHWGIRDAAAAGNLLYFGQFDIPIALNAGDPLTVAVGSVTIREE